MPAPLLIADVPWLLYRSFFALPASIADGAGHPVNALLGTVNALLALVESERPRCVVACMGAEQAEYRVKLYPPYHAHREQMPDELARQWALASQMLESLGWVWAASESLEADDVMFSYAREEEAANGRALLFTGDRDLYGAVSERVHLASLGKGAAVTQMGPQEVLERYGVPAALVPDFIALRGDPSDGLPGARGVGAKTAAALLGSYGSLEALLEAAEDAFAVRTGEGPLRPRVAAALREDAEQLRAFKQIATLQRIDVQPPADRATDYASGAKVARELGMRRLGERLAQLAQGSTA